MLIPLIGLIVSVIIPTIVGLLFLCIHPKWQLNFFTLFIFVIGAIVGEIVVGILYANFSQKLPNMVVVFGTFIAVAVAVGILTGGVSALDLMKKIMARRQAK